MKKLTKLGVQWFYNLLEKGECDILDFKEQLDDKQIFGKSFQNYSRSYEELARDVVAFANAIHFESICYQFICVWIFTYILSNYIVFFFTCSN